MRALVKVTCEQCHRHLGTAVVDTADLPEEVQLRVNAIIIRHRKDCRYYRLDQVELRTLKEGAVC